ncbi:hypothetical protein KY334_07525, partial [Candidatus Woesearchaeota archaeon]|nr:hypothetical protein [Candidatus Woesearchaeota archaeon]
MDYYNKTADECLKDLRTSIEGLSDEEAENRIKLYGLNEIEQKNKISPFKIFLEQFMSPLVIIL